MPQPDSRRLVLTAAVGTAVAGAVTVLGAEPASAAPVTRTVTRFRVLTYTYDAATRRTTVTSSRKERVVVRTDAGAYWQKNKTGAWVRIPYRWNAARKGLIYDRYLHLRLIAAAKKPVTPPPSVVPPGPASGNPYVGDDQAVHLLRRASYGGTAAELAEVNRIGVAAWVERQLHPAAIDDSACEAAVAARFPHLAEPIWQVNDLIDNGDYSGWQQMMDVCGAHIVRAAWSKRRLLTVMEDFWSNHFNVTCPHDGVAASRADYARVLRAGAFGRFSDLLPAVIQHPAMLRYLNNDISTWQHPNENLGRELLELHTVGLQAGYTEEDVLGSARILTGLSVNGDSAEFAWKPWRHWTGPVQVLGFSDPNPTRTGGLDVARRYLDFLAHHPDTARTIAFKLARRFVEDDPAASLVDDLADVYLAHDTEIAPVLRALFDSEAFRGSIGRKTRRPYEQLIATVRTLGLGPDAGNGTDGIFSLYWMADSSGSAPLGWGLPNGYPDVTHAWATTAATLTRWNHNLHLAAGWWGGDLTHPELRAYLFGATLPLTFGDLVDAAARKMLRQPLLPAHRTALLAFLGKAATDPVHDGSAAVNWRLPYWVAALLDTPYHLYT
jgi:uncharacterized protein (DUF1800 family)